MRLGELLVGGGLLTADQLEQALRAQVMWGGRLGTNLVELGFIELDALARALSQQHRLPAALAKHFERVDKELQLLLSADVAEKFQCVPLARVGPERSIVLATTGPLPPRAVAIVADELVVDPKLILVSVAAELRIRYHLERVYGIPRDARFLRSRGKTIPPFPTFQNTPETWGDVSEVEVPIPLGLAMPGSAAPLPDPHSVDVSLDDDDDESLPIAVVDSPSRRVSAPVLVAVEPAVDVIEELDDLSLDTVADDSVHEDDTAGRDRRRYVPTLADSAPIPVIPETSLGRIPIRRVAITTPPQGVVEQPVAAATLGEATRAIRRASGRDRVVELVIEAIQRFAPASGAALLLVLRGEVAVGWKGFVRGSTAAIPQIAVPLGEVGVVPGVVRDNALARCTCGELSRIDGKLFSALGAGTGDLVVVPITIAGRVMCMIATTTEPDEPLDVVESVAAAAAAAFARLMRDAAR